MQMASAEVLPAPGELENCIRAALTARQPLHIDAEGVNRAAVVVPLLFKRDEPHVLFTQRSQEVLTHKGHISFPGGMVEPEDGGPAAAALRETEEEVGIPRDQVRLLGQMDDSMTGSATFVITPFVAVVPDGAASIAS